MKKIVAPLILISLIFTFSNYGYSQTKQYSDFEPTIIEGSTVIEEIYSPALEGNLQGNPSTQPVKIYLPPGYFNYPGNYYPVLYLLHGYFEDYDNFYSEFGLLKLLNRVIYERDMVPMIIVTPNASTIYNGSFYTNSYVSGSWEDYIVQDVIPNIESNYRILGQKSNRGLAGFSMGGQGTARIGMKHASLFISISIIDGPIDFEEWIINGEGKESIIMAVNIGDYRKIDPPAVRGQFAAAVAYSPDSCAKPVMGRLPYTADGQLIDSIWQKWLHYDPYSMLEKYKDSLLKLSAIQIYASEDGGFLPCNETFHQALLDDGIEHDYEVYSGGHNPTPVMANLLSFFSEQLAGIVPTVRSSNDYYLENTDILVAETDMDVKLYVVQSSAGYGLDSILKHQLITADALAHNETEFLLSGFEFGKYRLFAISSDTIVCNIPVEFCVVPVKDPPDLLIDTVNVVQGEPISVSINRDGTICLVKLSFIPEIFPTASDIMNSAKLQKTIEVNADTNVKIITDDLAPGSYSLYGFDNYGIFTGPVAVQVLSGPTGVMTNSLPVIRLYPNPVTSTVSIQTDRHALYDLSVSSPNGQLLHESTMEGTTDQIDLSSFQKGVYFITIRSEDYVITRKIIKL